MVEVFDESYKEILFSAEQSILLELFSKGLLGRRWDSFRRVLLNLWDLKMCGGRRPVHGKCHQGLGIPDVEASRLAVLLPWRPSPCPLTLLGTFIGEK